MPIANYRELRVWQSAMQLSRDCYHITRVFPRNEVYGLSSQVRRAAISVAANIAEGNGRFTRPDYIRHLSIANGSLRELETLLLFARGMGWAGKSQTDRALSRSDETGRMLIGLAKSLRAP
jgi:four helix bundle protein